MQSKAKQNREMEILSKNEMEKSLGGGWILLPNGVIVYVPDGDEDDDNDTIFL